MIDFYDLEVQEKPLTIEEIKAIDEVVPLFVVDIWLGDVSQARWVLYSGQCSNRDMSMIVPIQGVICDRDNKMYGVDWYAYSSKPDAIPFIS